jgi:hypothetical protein
MIEISSKEVYNLKTLNMVMILNIKKLKLETL